MVSRCNKSGSALARHRIAPRFAIAAVVVAVVVAPVTEELDFPRRPV